MKRWNFSGQNATHGNSKAHRLPGSIGQCEYPGKVWKGKKMAGRMGGISATVLNQRVVKVDMEKSLIYVLGNIPGPISGVVRIRDAVKKIDKQLWDLQYPTYLPTDELSDRVITWDGGSIDPNEIYYHENDVVSGEPNAGED